MKAMSSVQVHMNTILCCLCVFHSRKTLHIMAQCLRYDVYFGLLHFKNADIFNEFYCLLLFYLIVSSVCLNIKASERI
jgi:hypothetical protein